MSIEINLNQSVQANFRRLQQDNIHLSNENIEGFFSNGLNIFDSGKPIEKLLKEGPIVIRGHEWDFEYHYGLRSLVRRGFYKIIGEPFEQKIPNLRTGEEIPTWSANVLYCPDQDFEVYFEFLANIGPMVNAYALGFDLTSTTFEAINSNNLRITKDEFFISMKRKIFYVTQQRYVDTYYKQTVWFKIE